MHLARRVQQRAHRGCLDVLFDLSVFLRWPGVRPLLTAAEQERQRREKAQAE